MNAISDSLGLIDKPSKISLLELGCSDGKISAHLSSKYKIDLVLGVDLHDYDLHYNPFPCIQGDCQNLPLDDNTFEIAIGAALIEHLPDPKSFLAEAYRVLTARGILILTCPDPKWDFICTIIGYFKYANHLHRFSLKDLNKLLVETNFSNVRGDKFMIAPFNNSFFSRIESSPFGKLLYPIMMNQIIIARKII
jgi:ubiquinone/menaquinone biosynthesis C-methylase UbiE